MNQASIDKSRGMVFDAMTIPRDTRWPRPRLCQLPSYVAWAPRSCGGLAHHQGTPPLEGVQLSRRELPHRPAVDGVTRLVSAFGPLLPPNTLIGASDAVRADRALFRELVTEGVEGSRCAPHPPGVDLSQNRRNLAATGSRAEPGFCVTD